MQENEKRNITTIELDVKVKSFDKVKGEWIDTIVMGSKLTKADSGRVDVNREDLLIINIEPSVNSLGTCNPKINISATTKMTKADSGRA